MSRFCLGLALCAMLLALAACGGDSKGTDPTRDDELAEIDNWTEDDSLTNAIQTDSEKKSSDGKSSSSDEKNSSSSSVVSPNSSSSSVVTTVSVASPCKTATEDNCEYGTLTDDRDGQTYKTVKIGEQWWMAENLNYETATSSFCYNDSAEYCEKYGRLYGVSVRNMCPEGWSLPGSTEWNALITTVGGEATAGIMLKSMEGWDDNGNGSDSFGFSALPAGFRSSDGSYDDLGSLALIRSYWGGVNLYTAPTISLSSNEDSGFLSSTTISTALSVRCVKD